MRNLHHTGWHGELVPCVRCNITVLWREGTSIRRAHSGLSRAPNMMNYQVNRGGSRRRGEFRLIGDTTLILIRKSDHSTT